MVYVPTVAVTRISPRDLRRRERCIESHHLNLEKILNGLNGHPPPPVASINRAIEHVCGWFGLEVRVFEKFPPLLGLAPEKMDAALNYLTKEVGLSFRAINRFPSLLGYVVRDPQARLPSGRMSRKKKQALRPKVAYLKSLGIDVRVVLERAPQVLGLSVEKNLKPKVQFLADNGYGVSEFERDARIFTYSLQERIAPRMQFIRARGVLNGTLSYVLSLSDERFCNEYVDCTVQEYRDFVRRMNTNGVRRRRQKTIRGNESTDPYSLQQTAVM